MKTPEIIIQEPKRDPFNRFTEWGYSTREQYEQQTAKIKSYIEQIIKKFGNDVTANPLITTDDTMLIYMSLGMNPQLSEQDKAQAEHNARLHELASYGGRERPVPLKLTIKVPLKVSSYQKDGESTKEARIIMGGAHLAFDERGGETELRNLTSSRYEKARVDIQNLEDALQQVAEMPMAQIKESKMIE